MLQLTPSVSGLFKGRQFEPEVILLAGPCVFHCRTVRSRSCWPSGPCPPITSPSGGGPSATHRKRNALFWHPSAPQSIHAFPQNSLWMRPAMVLSLCPLRSLAPPIQGYWPCHNYSARTFWHESNPKLLL